MQKIMPESEWLEADGFGGFASGTAGGMRARRYHALLLKATTPPVGRMVLVNGVEAWLAGWEVNIPLTSQFYKPGIAAPLNTPMVSFSSWPWPKFVYQPQADAVSCSNCRPRKLRSLRQRLDGRLVSIMRDGNAGSDTLQN